MIQQETFQEEFGQSTLYDTTVSSVTGNSFFEAVEVLLRRRIFVIVSALAIASFGTLAVLSMPPSYKADAAILPPQQHQSSLSSIAGALGGISGSGVGSSLGLKNMGDLYIGILKSRTIADDLISSFNLQKVYHVKRTSDARRALSSHVAFSNGKDSLISISVKDQDPQLAAALANAFIDELYKQNSRIAISDASQRRLFFERELKEQRDELTNAELALKQTQQSTGLLVPAGQTEVLIRSGAQIRAEIAGRQVQLEAMRTYATDENPQVLVLKREIAALNSRVNQVEANGASDSKFEVSGSKLPEASLKYVRSVRDLKYHETLYELLAKQYEAARIDEAKQAPVIQVIDRAVVPDKDTRPARSILLMTAVLGGLLVSCIGALLWERAVKLADIWKLRQQLSSEQ